MQFIYHKDAKLEHIVLEGESFVHIFQSRRTKSSQNLALRNLNDDMLYIYKVAQINRKQAILELESSSSNPRKPVKSSHIIWAITEVKTIEKTLPFLNELGLTHLSLFYAVFSQSNQKPSLERLTKILIASCEQCGRTDKMHIEILSDTRQALKQYPNASVLDFTQRKLDSSISLADGVMIGPQGGFSQEEREMFANHQCYCFDTSLILKSQTAAISVLAKFL